MLVIGLTDTVAGTDAGGATGSLTVGSWGVGVGVTVGRTVAVGVGVTCVGATVIGRMLALGVAEGLMPELGEGVVVGLIVAVGGTEDTVGALAAVDKGVPSARQCESNERGTQLAGNSGRRHGQYI